MKQVIRHIWSIEFYLFLFILFLLSHFFLGYYWVWVFRGLMFLITGIVFIYFSVFKKLTYIVERAARGLLRVFGLIGGVLLIVMYFVEMFSSLLDMGSYLQRDYRQVTGVPVVITELSSKTGWHKIEVDGVELLNTKKGINKYLNKEIKCIYLPKSKFIVKMQTIQ